jgi:DNA-binding NarL/FixJ family response regulator
MDRIRVLMVDDTEVHLEGMRSYLERTEDLELVGVARDGKSAIALIRELKPDVLVLDMNLGKKKMSGVDVAEILSNDPNRPRILALSEYDSSTYIFGVLEKANGYLLKSEPLAQIADGIRGVYKKEEYWYSREVVALLSKRAQGNDAKRDPLSPKERKVMRLLGWGMSDREIAKRLAIEPSTAHNHRESIYRKLNLRNMGEAAAWAWRHGYMDDATVEDEDTPTD